MASPQSFKDGSAVQPADPTAPDEADSADPGEVSTAKAEQIQSKSGKYGSVKVEHLSPESQQSENSDEKLTWIEIELVGEDDKPIPGEEYKITTSDNKVVTGTLDEKGFARREGIKEGTCKVTFPRLDKDAWKKA